MESTDIFIVLNPNLKEILTLSLTDLDKTLQTKCESLLLKEKLLFDEVHQVYKCLTENNILLEPNFKYLHQWIEESKIIIPTVPVPTTTSEYKARISRLQAQQNNREYNKMTFNVDKSRAEETNENSFGKDIKEIKSQMFAVLNFILTVGGTFMFGYKATEYSMLEPDIPRQILAGMTMATIVALAELYFLAKMI